MLNVSKMGKNILLMSSSRVHGHGYLEHAKELLTGFFERNNVKTVLFVPYALPDYDKYTSLVSEALSPWGFNVVGLHTQSNVLAAIEAAEAIFVGGGNTFVLLNTLYEKLLIPAIREQVLNKGTPYIGSSAGTNVATRSIHTTNDMPMIHPPSFDALNLVPFNINPHFLDADPESKHKGETREERLSEFLEYHRRPVLGLREGTSVLIDNDKAILVGDRCAKLFRPDQDPLEIKPNDDLNFLMR